MTETTIAKPDDPATEPAQLIEAANALVPVLAERAAAAETARRLPDETISDLIDAGLLQMRLPTQLGGSGSDMLTETLVSAALAKGCAATSWVRAILSGGAGAAALLPPAGLEEVFGSETAPLVCGVVSLGGVATPVEDGFVVSGSWGFASGCLHAGWAGLGVRFERGPGAASSVDGEPLPTVGAVVIPMADLRIKDTWHVAGLCATGSNTLVAEDVFVPSHRLLTVPNAVVAMLERSPQVPRFAVALLGTLLGAAEGLLALVSDNATKRGVNYFHHELQADSDAVAMRIGESAMRIDTAWLHARRAIADLMAETSEGPMSYRHSTRGQADSAYAATLLRETASTLVSLAGGSSFAMANAMQRAWRDITVGSNHAMLNATASLELHGRALLGRPSNSPFWGPDAAFLA